MKLRAPVRLFAALLVALVLVVACAAQSSAPPASSIDIYVHTARAVTLPGLTDLVVLDPDVVAVESTGETVRLTGLRQGETVALATIHGTTASLVLRVVMPPIVMAPPTLLHLDLERGVGMIGSELQFSRYNEMNVALVNSTFQWSQQIGDRRLEIASDVQDISAEGQPRFNLRTGSVAYLTPGLQVRGLDFNQDVTGADIADRPMSYIVGTLVSLRGGDVRFVRGKDQVTFYGGTTIPYYFLTLATTRDVAGVTVRHQFSEHFAIYGGTAYVNAPKAVDFEGGRHNGFMQTGGFHYAPNEHWSFNALGGVSTRGSLGRGDVTYRSRAYTAYASAQTSAPFFPLNETQALFNGVTDFRTGITLNTSRRFTESASYEHAVSRPGTFLLFNATSDYVTGTVGALITRTEAAQFSYTYSRTAGGYTGFARTGSRYQGTLNSTFRPRWTNSAQVTLGSVEDPLGLNSNNELQFSDAFSFPIKIGDMSVSFSHDRTDPSLVRRLANEFNLLSPQLRQLLATDPLAIQEANLPPDIRELIDAQIPTNTVLFTSAHFAVGRRITVSPNFAFSRVTDGLDNDTWTKSFGYQFNYQARPSLLLRSSLTSVWAANQSALPGHEGFQRSYILTFGFQKMFSGSPLLIGLARGSRTIEGRVFRDENINGAYNAGEPGLAGIVVALDGGRTTKTDSEGKYRFTNVSADEHRVSIALEQFPTAVRMTTSSEFTVRMTTQRTGGADFGVVNFARVMGSVFNDLRFEGKRQIDSVPIGDVHLLLTQSGQLIKNIAVPSSGDFEASDVPPGDYDLAVDAGTVPPDYSVPIEHMAVHVAPVSSVNVEIPLHALRSISGHVFLRVLDNPTPEQKEELNIQGVGKSKKRKKQQDQAPEQAPSYKLVPLAGVQLTADHTVVKTDSDGAFILRHLPAGDLTVTLVPLKPLPPGMKVPAGTVHLPSTPVRVEGATIVISNPELVPYLTNLNEQAPAVIAAQSK